MVSVGNALLDFERDGTNVTNKIHSTFSQSIFENAFKLCFPLIGPVDIEKTCPWSKQRSPAYLSYPG